MTKRAKRVPVIICFASGDRPYWAYTAFGGSIHHATEDALEKQLNFVYGIGRWFELDRRLAEEITDIPADALCEVRGDVPKLFAFVRQLAETPWGEWKLRSLKAKARTLVTKHTYQK